MTAHTFKKIMAGLDDARAYLDGAADKRRYRAHNDPEGEVAATTNPTSGSRSTKLCASARRHHQKTTACDRGGRSSRRKK